MVHHFLIPLSVIFMEIMELVAPWYINEETPQNMMNVAKKTAAVRA